MNRQSFKCLLSLFLLLFVFCPSLIVDASAQAERLVLDAEQHWENYGVGGACNHGNHNLIIADVDGDGIMEITVGAFTYNSIDAPLEGSLKIWSWSGSGNSLELEQSASWSGSVSCVHAGDADGDGTIEIFTAGTYRNETGFYSSFRVWHLNNGELTLDSHYEGVQVNSVFIGDVEKDGATEIITVGSLAGDPQHSAKLCFWNLEQNNLVLKETLPLDEANVKNAASVYAFDLDGNGEVEIITGGYSGALNNSMGQLSVWNWNGQELSLRADEKWQMVADSYAQNIAGGVLGNTVVNNLKVGDVDGDGVFEIVTGGFVYDGESVNGQLLVWSWTEGVLSQEGHAEWISDSITLVYCVSLGDVDGDSRLEVVAGGMTGAYGSFASDETSLNRAQLRVWGWDGTSLVLEHDQDWTIGEGVTVANVATADLDKNGKMEIVTVGCMSLNRLCDPDMRIWSIQAETANSSFLILAIAGIIAVAVILTAILLLLRKKK